MRIIAEETMAIIVDYQERLLPAIYENEDLIKNSRILIEGLGALEVPMIVTQQYTKGLGMTAGEITTVVGSEDYLEKTTFSCCDDEGIMNAVKQTGRKNVILCGIESHVCLLQTAIDLVSAGYNVVMVADCVSSRKPSDKKYAIKRAISEGVFITTYEAILFELTRKAGTDAFKAISKLVK